MRFRGLALMAFCLAACGSSGAPAPSVLKLPPMQNAKSGPTGPLRAPGGPFLVDADGRAVLMHGANLMFKVPPYEIVTSGSGVNVLTRDEAAKIASLGFDVVRLGIIWKGLEPGTAKMNDPSICKPGAPRANGPGQFDQKIFDAYMKQLQQTIALLAHYGIYSLIDMHQDAMNEVFAGEGFPDWAVCTDGIVPQAQYNVPDWGVNDLDPGISEALGHFWANDVVGNIQGEFDKIWARVAAKLRGNPWVIGYDPYNEPFASGMLPPGGNNTAFDAQLQCFYGGRKRPGTTQAGQPITCPPDDPANGLIPAIQAADPGHPVFYEPDTTTNAAVASRVGAMPFAHLVLNFHDYCFLHSPNGPESSAYNTVCPTLEDTVFQQRLAEAKKDANSAEPDGLPVFMSEFGATNDTADLARITADANNHLVGWIYWEWLEYEDPTGSHTGGLWPTWSSTADMESTLSQPYAQAVAGTPTSMSYDPSSNSFALSYTADRNVNAPTVVFVPTREHYPKGYCVHATGAHATSPAGAQRLLIQNDAGAKTVSVSLKPGGC